MAITRILGMTVSNRREVAADVQKILSRYGCSIRTRLGINDSEDEGMTEAGGLIILELTGEITEWEKLEAELRQVLNVEVNKMDFTRGRHAG